MSTGPDHAQSSGRSPEIWDTYGKLGLFEPRNWDTCKHACKSAFRSCPQALTTPSQAGEAQKFSRLKAHAAHPVILSCILLGFVWTRGLRLSSFPSFSSIGFMKEDPHVVETLCCCGCCCIRCRRRRQGKRRGVGAHAVSSVTVAVLCSCCC